MPELKYSIDVDRTTVSDEIKGNRFVRSPIYDKFDKNGIEKIAYKCDLLLKPPYVCNTCVNKRYYIKNKLYYNARFAQEISDRRKSQSISGVDISPQTIEEIENTIVPLLLKIKNKVSIKSITIILTYYIFLKLLFKNIMT